MLHVVRHYLLMLEERVYVDANMKNRDINTLPREEHGIFEHPVFPSAANGKIWSIPVVLRTWLFLLTTA